MTRSLLGVARWFATLPWLGDKIATVARHIVAANRGAVGEPDRNGEHELIRRVAQVSAAGRPFTVFDVGANIGDWTAQVLREAPDGVAVHLFEPSQGAFAALGGRFAADDRVNLTRAAVAARDGSARLRVYGPVSGLNSLVDTAYHMEELTFESVPTVSGDRYCASRGIRTIDLLKIDTEGFEWDVLEGFAGMLEERRIRVIQFEYGYIHAITGHLMRDFFALFEGFGYVVGPVRPRGPEFRPLRHTDNDFDSGPNYVAALPDVAAMIGRV